jgi:ferritin-like metal-binding protein YciE
MAESVRDVMITGLRNAHAMEAQAVQLLQRQSERLGDYPQLQARVQQHLEETRGQQAQLEALLSRFDTSTSGLKEAALGLVANMQAMFHAATEDEVLKNSFASYAFEHFEQAAYRSLVTMARQAGEPEVERVCGEILRQEEAMANWLRDNLDQVTRDYLRVQGHG